MKGTTKPKGFGMAAAGLLATLLIAALIVPAMAGEDGEELTVVNAQGPDSGGKPVLLDAKDALLCDAQEYASDMGVSTDEALRRLQLQDSIGELNAELITNEVATFAGLWIEHTPEYRVVVQFTHDSEETIKPYLKQHTELADIVEVRTANVSLADLRKAQANVSYSVSALGIPAESGISVDTNSVELYMTEADRSRFDDALEKGEIRLPDNVGVITVEALSENTTDIHEGETSPPDETPGESVPGFGLLGGLIAVLCGWIFIRKRA